MTPRWYNQTINMFISIGNGSPRNTLYCYTLNFPLRVYNVQRAILRSAENVLIKQAIFIPRMISRLVKL